MRSARIGTRRWLPSRRLARRSRGLVLGGVWLRCRAWRRRHELDRQLARGADPMQSDELSLRVGQLGSAGTRVRLAHALREAVALANGHRPPLITTRLRRREIRDNEALLVALADRIRDGGPLGVQGLAITARLINDALQSAVPIRSDRFAPGRRVGSTGGARARPPDRWHHDS